MVSVGGKDAELPASDHANYWYKVAFFLPVGPDFADSTVTSTAA